MAIKTAAWLESAKWVCALPVMGLFDPPAAKIRKRLTSSAQKQYDKFVEQVRGQMPSDLGRKEAELVVGFVAAAWVASENREKRIELGNMNGRYVQEMLEKCHDKLGPGAQAATDLVEKFRAEGVIMVRT